MKKKLFLRRLIAPAVAMLIFFAMPLSAWSQAVGQSEAAAIASRATGGRVLNVELQGGIWRVKVLVRGNTVRVVYVDANTGQIQ